MQINEVIEKKFGSWVHSFSNFIQSKEFDNIMATLKEEALVKKKVICPKSADTFKSLAMCDKSKLKAVVMLMDPYPTMKDGIMVSDGVPMSCKNTGVTQASICHWWHGVESEYGFMPDMDHGVNIDWLLEEEHVLLINSALSVELSKSGSHAHIWQSFMKELFRILNEEHRGLPIVLCGASAQKYEKEINPLLHYVKKVEHMAAAAHQNRSWKTEGMFKWVNQILEANNGSEYKIKWWRDKTSKKVTKLEHTWMEDRIKSTEGADDLPW